MNFKERRLKISDSIRGNQKIYAEHIKKWEILGDFMGYGHFYINNGQDLPKSIAFTDRKLNAKEMKDDRTIRYHCLKEEWMPTIDYNQAHECEKELMKRGNYTEKIVNYPFGTSGIVSLTYFKMNSNSIHGHGSSEIEAICNTVIAFAENPEGYKSKKER